jgi:hypothetical protein
MVTEIPRGTVIGKVTGGPPLTEAEHFFKCENDLGRFDSAISARCSITRSRCPIRWKIKRSSAT